MRLRRDIHGYDTSPRLSVGCSTMAFTLVELLIATLCFAIILAALNSAFYATMRLRSRTEALVGNDLPVNQAAATIRRDLQCIVMPSTNSTGTLSGPLTTQPQSVIGTLASGPGGILEFNTTSGILGEDPVYWSEVQQVAYYLKPPEFRDARGMDLVRGVCRNLLPIVTNTLTDLKETRLLSGIDSMSFSFYDGTNWQTWWDSTYQQQLESPLLPQLVKIAISFTSAEGGKVSLPPLAIEVPVLLQARASESASGGSGGQSVGGGSSSGGSSSRGTSGGGSSSSGRSTGGGSGGGGGYGSGGGSSGGRSGGTAGGGR